MAATTDHSIDVEWDPPVDNGGGEILGYHVDKVSSFTHMDFQLSGFFSDSFFIVVWGFAGHGWYQRLVQVHRASLEEPGFHCLWSS